jgi:lysophospholipase L1-like esterase
MLRHMPRAIRAIIGGLAAALALASCSSSDSSAPTDIDPDLGTNDSSVVVALGDSITFGYGDTGISSCEDSARDDGGFCPRLQSLVGKTVINRGVCGASSYDGVDQVEEVLDRYHPGVLLIDYSPNDLFYGSETVIANLRTMITAARNNKTVPILGTLVPAVGDHKGWEPFIETVNAQILALCDEQGIECADHWKAFVNDPGFIASPYALLAEDGLHPNAAGYELMARTWRWPLLRVY